MTDILVDVRPAVTTSGDVRRRGPATPESFADRAGDITDTITEVADKLQGRLEADMASKQSALWQLTTVELGFQLALQAEAGVVIARASTEATFSVTLTWSRGGAAG